MKFLKNILTVAALLTVTCTAFAQRGFDTYSIPRWLTLAPPTTIAAVQAGSTTTNSWVDIKGLDGVAAINVFCSTNVGNTTFTVAVQASNDQTNLAWLASASIATPATIIYTNTYYGGTNASGAWLNASDVFNLAGAITTPTASIAGWATPYLNAAANPFTNTLSSVTLVQAGYTTIGFNAGDAPRYLRLIVIPTGAATNGVVGAQICGNVHSSSYPF